MIQLGDFKHFKMQPLNDYGVYLECPECTYGPTAEYGLTLEELLIITDKHVCPSKEE